ncbi:MAG: phosphatidylglycerophosphatase A [bacterium]|nr:phosphatidylglycerophosphatase A [bacterium]
MKNKLWVLIATVFYIGRIPILPGTITSLVTMLLMYYIPAYWQAPYYVHLVAIAVVFFIGVPAANAAEVFFNKKDPGQCTIDEVAGQMIALLFVPHEITYYIAGFVLFRIFDMAKPFPVRSAEKIPRGYGVMADDVAAGLYALIPMQIYLLFFLKP